MQSEAISEWSDDNEALVAPPLSTKASSRNIRTEVQSEGGEGVPEQQAEKMPMAGPQDLPPRTCGLTPEQCLGAWGGSVGLEPSTGKLMCKYLCLGIGSYPIFVVAVIDELI